MGFVQRSCKGLSRCGSSFFAFLALTHKKSIFLQGLVTHVSALMKYRYSDTLRFLLRVGGSLAIKLQLRCGRAESPRTLHAAYHGLFAPAPAKLAIIFLYALFYFASY